jgi:hypothetical protein
MDVGSLVDDFTDYEIIQNDEKSGDLVIDAEPKTPRPIVEIIMCPICLHKCEGSQELLEHYWGYCMKTRTYFDTMMSVKE